MLAVVDPSFLNRFCRYVDLSSIETLITMIALSKGLELSGALQRLAELLLEKLGSRPRLLIASLLLTAGLTASIAMNDTVLFIYIPIALAICRALDIDRDTVVVLLVAAINLGSALTPIGNPQNIVLWRHSGTSFTEFTAFMSIFTVLSLSILFPYMALVMRSAKSRGWRKPPRIALRKDLLIASAILLPLSIALIDLGPSWLAPLLAVTVLSAIYPKIVAYIDWIVVTMLALMFIDFRELAHLLPLHSVAAQLYGYQAIALTALLSQVISNVPATIALLNYVDWRILAIGANVGGIGVLHSSLANLIAIRLARISIRKFHRYSLPLFLAVLALFEVLAALSLYP